MTLIEAISSTLHKLEEKAANDARDGFGIPYTTSMFGAEMNVFRSVLVSGRVLGDEGEFRVFTVRIDKKAAKEVVDLLNRSLNTMEPRYWPDWADGMVEALEEYLK